MSIKETLNRQSKSELELFQPIKATRTPSRSESIGSA